MAEGQQLFGVFAVITDYDIYTGLRGTLVEAHAVCDELHIEADI